MTDSRVVARIHVGLATLLALAASWVLFRAHQINEDTIAKYGQNLDSGALLPPFAILFLLPAAVLFALAATAIFKQWRIRGVLQWLATLWLSIPFVALLASWATKYFGA